MTWLTENVLWQDPGESLATVVHSLSERVARRPQPAGLAHILNPYQPGAPQVELVHKRTIDSIVTARRAADDVKLVAVVEAGHTADAIVFDEVVAIPTSAEGRKGRPRLFDVLEAGSGAAKPGSHVVFTNMDICLSSNFYAGVRELLGLGAEALIIRRRTVHDWDIGASSSLLAQFDLGESHPGMDCFIFPRSWVDGFCTSPAVIGHGHVMRSLLYNLVARSNPLVVLADVAMTYHFGDDRPWLAESARSQHAFNRSAAVDVYSALSADDISKGRLDAFVAALPKYAPKR